MHKIIRKELLKPICEGMSRVGASGKRMFLSMQPTKARGRVILGFANEQDAKAELAARNASDDGTAPASAPKPIHEIVLKVDPVTPDVRLFCCMSAYYFCYFEQKTYEVKPDESTPKFMIVEGDRTIETLDGERAKWTPAITSGMFLVILLFCNCSKKILK